MSHNNSPSKILKTLQNKSKKSMLAKLSKKSSFYILISTILSARNRDEMTMIATKKLFAKFKTPSQIASASLDELEPLIRQSGFYKTKAIRIKTASQYLLANYDGRVPSSIEQLTAIPGVGRKTANCVLVYAHQLPAIAVDVHVHRISNRLGWVTTKNPKETEEKLMLIFPRKDWIHVNEVLVIHGQNICHPSSPKCSVCSVKSYCPRIGVSRSR